MLYYYLNYTIFLLIFCPKNLNVKKIIFLGDKKINLEEGKIVSFFNNFFYNLRISSWDFHREKVILLTEKTLMIIAYDFISPKIVNYKRINLSDLKKIKFGNLKYSKGSFMG